MPRGGSLRQTVESSRCKPVRNHLSARK